MLEEIHNEPLLHRVLWLYGGKDAAIDLVGDLPEGGGSRAPAVRLAKLSGGERKHPVNHLSGGYSHVMDDQAGCACNDVVTRFLSDFGEIWVIDFVGFHVVIFHFELVISGLSH